MPANIYVGVGRSGSPPLPVETNNQDVRLMSTPTPVGSELRACDTQVSVRNSGSAAANCVVHLCYLANYVTSPVLVQCWHDGQQSITSAASVTGGGPAVPFRTIGDIPVASTPLVGVVYVNGVYLNPSTPVTQNPVCGVRIV